MGLGYAFNQVFKGNFENAFNGLFSDDSLLAAQDAAGDNLSKIIQRQQAAGLIDEKESMDLYSLMAPNTDSDAYWESGGNTPFSEFTQSLEDSASKNRAVRFKGH